MGSDSNGLNPNTDGQAKNALGIMWENPLTTADRLLFEKRCFKLYGITV
jgi:hypothetical protein